MSAIRSYLGDRESASCTAQAECRTYCRAEPAQLLVRNLVTAYDASVRTTEYTVGKIVIAILLGSESTTSLYQANPMCEDVYLRSGTHYKHQLLRNVCNIECCSGRHCHLQKTPMSGAPCLEWDPEPLQVATYESSVSYKIPMSLRAASWNWNSGVTPPYLGGVTGFQNDGHFGCAALRLWIRSLGGDAYRRQHSDLG